MDEYQEYNVEGEKKQETERHVSDDSIFTVIKHATQHII